MKKLSRVLLAIALCAFAFTAVAKEKPTSLVISSGNSGGSGKSSQSSESKSSQSAQTPTEAQPTEFEDFEFPTDEYELPFVPAD